jgi:hypothetical protein
LDKNTQVDVIYIDFSKAFDRIDHNILLNKLRHFGFSDSLLNLFESYLSDRFCYVNVLGFYSARLVVNSGVPQGSNLGPLLFLLFINDIVEIFSLNVLLFADDVKLYSTIRDISDCMRLQSNCKKINKYLELFVDMRNLWSLEKISILPLIISAMGIVPQSLFKNLKILDLANTLVVEIQKGILLYSCHIVRKFLNIDTEHKTQQSQNAEARRR